MLKENYSDGEILWAHDMNSITSRINDLQDTLMKLADPNTVKTTPAFKITWSNTGKFEAGTKVALGYYIGYTDGQYIYPLPNGTPMQCPATNYNVRFNGEVLTSNSDNFSTITIQENTELTALASATYGNSSVIPLNNFDIPQPDKQFEGATITLPTAKITGYREGCFYGAIKSEDFSIDKITSTLIRSLNKSKNQYTTSTLQCTIPIGTTAIIIACPALKPGPQSVVNTTVNAPMTTLYGADQIATNLIVEGANGETGTLYNIWIYQPITPYSQKAELTIKLG